MTAGQRKGNWPHQVKVQAWPWRFRHLHLSAICVDTEQFAVSNQSFADVWVEASEVIVQGAHELFWHPLPPACQQLAEELVSARLE